MKQTTELDHAKVRKLVKEYTHEIVKIFVSTPNSTESSAAALMSLMQLAITCATAMWNKEEAVRVLHETIKLEMAKRDIEEAGGRN